MPLPTTALPVLVTSTLASAEQAGDDNERGEDDDGDDDEPDDGLFVEDEAFGAWGLVFEEGAAGGGLGGFWCRCRCRWGRCGCRWLDVLTTDVREVREGLEVLVRVWRVVGVGGVVGFDAAGHCCCNCCWFAEACFRLVCLKLNSAGNET